MLSDDIVDDVIAAAKGYGIAPAALLAVVEIESNGAPFELDGRTPRLLFERHVFHRELKARAPEKLAAAVKQGLAIPKWSRATQYKDQGRSAGRLALLDAARTVDLECANRACSWGLGQTMGFLAEELGYVSATDMVARMVEGGVRAQIAMMVQEIKRKGLVEALNAGQWAQFARRYNGPAYRENQYDTKLSGAHRRWTRTLAGTSGPAPASARLSRDEVMAVQQKLTGLGYRVGDVDGLWGPDTTGGVSAFQRYEGIPVTGDLDAATREALRTATGRAVSDARAATTIDDLRAAGSQTVAAADKGRLLVKVLAFLGIGGGVSSGIGGGGTLDQAQQALDQVQQARPLIETARDILSWVGSAWWIGALVIAYFVWREFGAVIERRIADRVSGRHV